jgi:hypothetical protein
MNFKGDRKGVGLFLAGPGALLLGSLLWLVSGVSSASVPVDPCARADARLAATGMGDSDFDGLSNCRERRTTGTVARDDDSDDDGIEDGAEVVDGTNPLDDDSDDDGLSDGDEQSAGTDPHDSDDDDDGSLDGSDSDPADELHDELEGDVSILTCPSAGADGSITVLGIAIVLTADTEFEGAESCQALADRIAANGSAHVEVEVGQGSGSLTAIEVELEDADNDGSPDDIDSDDDEDGVSDDDDDDDDGDGVSDDSDDD